MLRSTNKTPLSGNKFIFTMDSCTKDLEAEVAELREAFDSGRTKEESWRRLQLKNLISLLEEKEDDIFQALKQDLGKHPIESYRDEVCFSSRILGLVFKLN